LGAVSGASTNTATGINDRGQVVGIPVFPDIKTKPPRPGPSFAFISTSSGLVELNTLVPSGYNLEGAVGINDAGQILCRGTTPSGEFAALLLTPVP
jgi:hypothetical protein